MDKINQCLIFQVRARRQQIACVSDADCSISAPGQTCQNGFCAPPGTSTPAALPTPPTNPAPGSVAPGGACTQDADCQAGNTCQNAVCAGMDCVGVAWADGPRLVLNELKTFIF